MKKNIFAVLCCFLLLLSGCDRNTKYKRIDLQDDFLELELENHIGPDTELVNLTQETFPAQLPIYRITERKITQQEFQKAAQLGNSDPGSDWLGLKLDGNKISGRFESYGSGYCSLSEEALEKLARETLEKLTFLDGDYAYVGITGSGSISDATGEHATDVCVSFRRLVDGLPVKGNERCEFTFNDNGLVGVHIVLYNYKQIGTMDLVPLEDAQARIQKPDAFSIDCFDMETVNLAKTLQVDIARLFLVNLYADGCTILQPIYQFGGTAMLEDGTQSGFSSTVIAIPTSYTQ